MKNRPLSSYMMLVTVALIIAGFCLPVHSRVPPPAQSARVSINTRNVSPANRTHCPESPPEEGGGIPPNRVNTTSRVRALQQKMAAEGLDAYIVLISDEHGTAGSEFDQRVTYISGFTGSNGFAIVTANQSALWTDGRYFLQAEHQLECFWILMKISTAGYPTGPEWLADILSDGAKVGAYAKYVSIDTWNSYRSAFNSSGKAISIDPVPGDDLVDIVWTEAEPNRTAKPTNPLIIHSFEFTGKNYSEKVIDVRQKISDNGADCLVVTVLEESAWLFNLRGTDRTDSLFYGYSIIYADDNRASELFINNISRALADTELIDHLNLTPEGSCRTPGPNCITLHEYTEVEDFIKGMPSDMKMWLDPSASYAIYLAISEARVISPMKMSPIALMKAIKNEEERTKFAKCILRDSAAVVEFMASFEPRIKNGEHWTEISAATELQRIRSQYEHYRGLSFDTISAFGPNAAVIHYRPSKEKNADITTEGVYLLDSGGQYTDGTTDVTRTFHFGQPSDIEKEAYTRVLMGAIDLATTVWPFGYYGSDIDSRARTPLWQNGWDYNHGTGHGIGYWLSVHEGPGRINIGYNPAHAPLYEGMFFSDEPGYYEDGSFGIRLETLVSVVEAKTPHRFNNKTYLAFRPATLVPFEPNMIKYELLSHDQVEWLNEYHKRCEDEVGKYLLDVRHNDTAYNWLVARTQPITVNMANSLTSSTIVVSNVLVVFFARVFMY